MLSLRVRVFLLVVIVAVAATGATAWLTLRNANTQLSDTAIAQTQTVDRIRRDLADYGLVHGTWERLASLVRRLRSETGQRIQLTTVDGQVIVDTDQLEGRTARPRGSQPAAVVDARPTTDFSRVPAPLVPGEALTRIEASRVDTRLAACYTRRNLPFTRRPDASGLERVLLDPGPRREPGLLQECKARSASGPGELAGDATMLADCLNATKLSGVVVLPTTSRKGATELAGVFAEKRALFGRDAAAVRRCAADTFSRRITDVAPVSLLLYLGSVTRPGGPAISTRRALAAASGVALLVIAATVLVSRRVLRPIGTLIRASRRLGDGDLSERVPVRGRDELAEMASAFNRMADSLERSKGQQRRMIGDVAHELRTPLANVRGYLEALKDGVLEPTPELFASLHEEAVLQQRLVDDLQELALAEAGALVYHRMRLDPAELLETCRTAHLAVAEAAGVRLSVEVESAAVVDGDPDRLRQAIGNLVSNALQATPAGGWVALRARVRGDRVLLEVADSGSGIDPADLPHVFDRLYRADAARARDTGGRGLGLAIAREIVTAHGGTMTASSTLGAGSTFTIELPAAEAGAPTAAR